MTKGSDSGSADQLANAATPGLEPILSISEIGSEFSATTSLIEKASAQLAMATMEPLSASYSAAIAATSASIREALKPSLAMQSVMDIMRPIREMQAQLLPTRSAISELSAKVVELTQVGQIAKEMASVQSFIKNSALFDTKLIREQLMLEPLRGASLAAAELAAIATVNSFKHSSRIAELVSMGSSLLHAGNLAEAQDINWEAPASSELLSAIAAAAETLKEAPEPTPDLANLPDASNDDDGGQTPSQQQLQSELADAATSGDLSKLSPAAKTYFKFFCWLIFALLNYVALQNAVREELCFLQPKILPGMTAGQMGKTVRKALCEAALVIDGDYRLVKGLGVHLRDAPSTKAAILSVHLADGQVVEVLDSSNPDWLHVTVIDENIEGWVSRKYTRVLSLN
jgi:hypothetical protein